MDNYSIIKRFKEVCKSKPNDKAVIDVKTNNSITYHELDECSGKVYRYLCEHNIGREDVVMIFLPRGAKPIISIVGVWKAGAAYVLLEDFYPEEKKEFIRKDSNCKLVIDNDVFAEMMHCEVLEGYKVADPHDLSFIVYTSGTTGNPKGVMLEYGTIDYSVRSEYWHGEKIYKEGDRDLFIAPLNFSASIMLMHYSLDVGATIVITPLTYLKNLALLISVIEKYHITLTFLSPSLLRLIPKFPKSVYHIASGSEPLKGIYYDNIDLFNKYAQTESGYVILTFKTDKNYENTPLGKPTLKEAEVCVLDENGKFVKDGEIGEICYRQPYLRGYLNLPEKTKELFINGYVRSGDLGKILPDGNFHLIGRKDDMIKINGNRVEPEEIEVIVKKILGVDWVGVRGFEEDGKSYICAYYIGKPTISIEEVKDIIRSKLVSYMVPAFYIPIDKIPLSPNGKFRRNDLPKPDFSKFKREYVAPRNEMEKKLCDVMKEVLGVERVGITDDFYEIGGDSINAIKIVTKLNSECLNTNMIFNGRTPKKIVEMYNEALDGNTESYFACDARIQKKEVSLTQTQLFMFDYQCYYPKSTLWNISFLLRLDRNVDMGKLKKAIDVTLKNHPVFSISFDMNANSEFVQKFDQDKVFDIKIENISEADFIDESEKLVKPFNLLKGSMYRVKLFKTERGGYLFFDIHHTIADGTSIQILLRDICKVYDGKPIDSDYYYAVVKNREKEMYSSLYDEGKKYYDSIFGQDEWDACLKPDFEIKGNEYGCINTIIPIDNKSYDEIYKKYGMSKNVFYIMVTGIAMAIYNNKNNIRVTWVYNGRKRLSENDVIGALYKSLYVGILFDEKKSLKDVYFNVLEQINNGIRYSSCFYVENDSMAIDCDDVAVNYQSNFRNNNMEGSLKFEGVEILKEKYSADNLINVEINDDGNYCKLCLAYNASAYKYESIYWFKKILLKVACILVENIDNPDLKVMEIINRFKKEV